MSTPIRDPEQDLLHARPRSATPDPTQAEAVDTPLGQSTLAAAAQPATGHYGPGYGDPTPTDPARADPADLVGCESDYQRWRAAHLKQLDEDFVAWRGTGATQFPEDFDAWRRARHELIVEQSSAGLPLVAAGEDAPEMTKASLLFERS